MEKINQSGQSDERSEWLSSGRSNHVWEWFAIKVIREMWKCQHDSGFWSEWLEKCECFDSELAFQDLTSRPRTNMKFWSRLINGSGLNTNTTLERRERRSGSAARPTSPPGSEPSRLSTSTSSPLPPSPLPQSSLPPSSLPPLSNSSSSSSRRRSSSSRGSTASLGEDGYGTTFVELIKRTGSHLGVSIGMMIRIMVTIFRWLWPGGRTPVWNQGWPILFLGLGLNEGDYEP